MADQLEKAQDLASPRQQCTLPCREPGQEGRAMDGADTLIVDEPARTLAGGNLGPDQRGEGQGRLGTCAGQSSKKCPNEASI